MPRTSFLDCSLREIMIVFGVIVGRLTKSAHFTLMRMRTHVDVLVRNQIEKMNRLQGKSVL